MGLPSTSESNHRGATSESRRSTLRNQKRSTSVRCRTKPWSESNEPSIARSRRWSSVSPSHFTISVERWNSSQYFEQLALVPHISGPRSCSALGPLRHVSPIRAQGSDWILSLNYRRLTLAHRCSPRRGGSITKLSDPCVIGARDEHRKKGNERCLAWGPLPRGACGGRIARKGTPRQADTTDQRPMRIRVPVRARSEAGKRLHDQAFLRLRVLHVL